MWRFRRGKRSRSTRLPSSSNIVIMWRPCHLTEPSKISGQSIHGRRSSGSTSFSPARITNAGVWPSAGPTLMTYFNSSSVRPARLIVRRVPRLLCGAFRCDQYSWIHVDASIEDVRRVHGIVGNDIQPRQPFPVGNALQTPCTAICRNRGSRIYRQVGAVGKHDRGTGGIGRHE